MRRAGLFAGRNVRELIRDPLSHVFCVGFPVVMLLIFRLVAHYTPGEVYWFDLVYLVPGITVFSYTFTMLYMALLVSRDRCSAFLRRLFGTPMSAGDFVCGYALSGMIVALGQTVVCCAFATVLGIFDGNFFPFRDMVRMTVALLPAMLLFVFLGILLGTLLSDRAAPGIASVIISAGGFLSGAWMPLETMGELETVATCLPFYPAVCLSRCLFGGGSVNFDRFWGYFLIVAAYMLAAFAACCAAFNRTMSKD